MNARAPNTRSCERVFDTRVHVNACLTHGHTRSCERVFDTCVHVNACLTNKFMCWFIVCFMVVRTPTVDYHLKVHIAFSLSPPLNFSHQWSIDKFCLNLSSCGGWVGTVSQFKRYFCFKVVGMPIVDYNLHVHIAFSPPGCFHITHLSTNFLY